MCPGIRQGYRDTRVVRYTRVHVWYSCTGYRSSTILLGYNSSTGALLGYRGTDVLEEYRSPAGVQV